MTTTIKTSVSINKKNWEKLKQAQNRSLIINEALTYYYQHEIPLKEHLKQAENEYWNNVEYQLSKNKISTKNEYIWQKESEEALKNNQIFTNSTDLLNDLLD
jgi:hypothetical protein